MEEILETTCSSAECSQEKGTVRDALGSGCGHPNRVMGRDPWDNLTSLREGLGDDGICNAGGFLLVCGADPGKDNDLLDWTAILFVNLHDVEEPMDRNELYGRNAGNTGIVNGDGKVIRLETPGEATNSHLAQYAHLAGNLCLQYHPDTDTFTVKNSGSQHGLNGVADGMAEIYEIAQTGLSFVDGDNVRFD